MSMPTKKPQRRGKTRALDRAAAGPRNATRETRHRRYTCRLPGEHDGHVLNDQGS